MSKKTKTLEQKIYNALIGRPRVADAITDEQQSLPIIRRIIAQHRNTSFSADDIRVFLSESLPYYPREGEDEFHYNVTAEDIDRVSLELFELLKRGQHETPNI